MNFINKWNRFLINEQDKPNKDSVERLAVFDFDGTLFRSPDEPKGFKGNWHASKKSLGPPHVDNFPDKSFWFKDTVAEAEKLYKDPKTFSILLTGRMKRNFEDRILELLDQNGIKFNYIEMNDSGVDTVDFKISEIKKILKKYPHISLIEFWDDKKDHLKKFKNEFTENQIAVKTHKVAQIVEENLLMEQDWFDTESIPKELLQKIAEKGIEMPPQIFTDKGVDVIDFKFELYDKEPPIGLNEPELKKAISKAGKYAVPFPPRDSTPKAYLIFDGGGLADLKDIVDNRPTDIPVLPFNWIDPIINKDLQEYKLISDTNKLLSELFKRGRTYKGTRNIAAFRSKVWSFGDSISRQMAKELVKDIGLSTSSSKITDYLSLRDALESDDRYDVIFGTIAGDRFELDSLNPSFRVDPQSSIIVKKIVDTYGLKSANYTGGESDLITLPKEKIAGKIPEHVYHGTTTKYLDNILKTGLRPAVSKTNYKDITHKNAVFFTSKVDEAAMHAEHACYQNGGDPVILVMRIPDPSRLKPDYDVDAHAEDIYYPEIKKKYNQSGRLRGKSTSWSREIGIHGYSGRIPPSFIDKIMIVPNGEQKLGSEAINLTDYTTATKEQAKKYLYNKENFDYGSFEDIQPEEDNF